VERPVVLRGIVILAAFGMLAAAAILAVTAA
jgi:hypothetical protein